ncbi:MAG: phosphatidylglycerol lysyltransferase domain-containing protein [Candidatus Muiribacteriota bacterium]
MNLKPITKNERELFENFFYKHNIIMCEFNFANLYVWGEIYKFEWTMFQNRLLIFSNYDDIIYMPQGENISFNQLMEISDYFLSQNKSGDFMFVNPDFVEDEKQNLISNFEIIPDIDDFDYVYETEKLVNLRGKKLNKKKNLISQFKRNIENYEIRLLEKKDFKDCINLSEMWCEDKLCDKMGFNIEMEAIKSLFLKYYDISVEGLGVFIDGKLEAFSVFSKLNHNTYDIHFEKFNTQIKGLPCVINNETAKYLSDKCKYLNREQDMGLPGLRKNKRSWEPEFLVESYYLRRKK